MRKLLLFLLFALPAQAQYQCVDSTGGEADMPQCTSQSMHVTPIAGATSSAKAEDAASANADTGTAAYSIRDDTLAADGGVGADGDYMPLRADNAGALYVDSLGRLDTATSANDLVTVKYAAFSVAGADSDSIVSAVASKKILVLAYGVVCDGAVNVTFEDGDGADMDGPYYLAANGGLARDSRWGVMKQATANKSLNVLKSAAVNCGGSVTYVEVD